MKMKITKYSSRYETVLAIIFGVTLGCFILYGALSQTLHENSDFIIGGFLVSAMCLLFGIWKLLNKKSIEYVNIDGWKYKLFQKTNKWPFIFISGTIYVLEISFFLFLLYFFNFLSAESLKSLNIKEISLIIVFFFFMILVFGYRIYKKYNSIDMESDFTGPY
jgi:hypothetical protein